MDDSNVEYVSFGAQPQEISEPIVSHLEVELLLNDQTQCAVQSVAYILGIDVDDPGYMYSSILNCIKDLFEDTDREGGLPELFAEKRHDWLIPGNSKEEPTRITFQLPDSEIILRSSSLLGESHGNTIKYMLSCYVQCFIDSYNGMVGQNMDSIDFGSRREIIGGLGRRGDLRLVEYLNNAPFLIGFAPEGQILHTDNMDKLLESKRRFKPFPLEIL